MSRYVNTIDLVYSLFAFADGKKSVGQCIDDTPSADVVERQKIFSVRLSLPATIVTV